MNYVLEFTFQAGLRLFKFAPGKNSTSCLAMTEALMILVTKVVYEHAVDRC